MHQFSIYPSLISSDLLSLGKTIELLDPHVQGYHIDIMDGHFVPNLTWGPQFVAAFQRTTSLPLHIHCMVSNPEKVLESLTVRPIDTVIIHVEATEDLHGMIEKIRDTDAQVGIALNPETSVKKYEKILSLVDHLLIMSVHPGFSGQTFLQETFKKYNEAKNLIDSNGYRCELGADGGVATHNVSSILSHGVKHVAAAKSIFSAVDPILGVQSLVQAVTK
ncbi:hypothetical protein COB28_04760 [Candidatus Dependentiae bacterium]|nr:MAG: hypothetical protein COB28_04760 [Candidatus Dependentiae bacterium]